MDYTLALPLPFPSALSLAPLLAWWQARADDAATAPGLRRLARGLVRRVQQQAPELGATTLTLPELARHPALIEELMMALFPAAAAEATISGAITPFDREVVHATPRFRQVITSAAGLMKQPLNLSAAQTNFYLTRFAYLLIIERFYGMRVPREETIIFTMPDYELGLYRHYKVELDSRFLHIGLAEGQALPELTADARRELVSNLRNLDRWLLQLPPATFQLRGFTVLHLTDVTEQQVLSTLKNDLLERDVLLASDRLEQLQEQLRALFRLPTLRFGLVAYRRKQGTFFNFSHQLAQQSLSQQLEDLTETNEFHRLYDRLVHDRQPLVIEDVRTDPRLAPSLRDGILALGIQNAILCLLQYGEEVLGVLELGAPEPGALTTFSLEKITQFLPLFAVAVHRHLEAQEARVQTLVKERFTAIHPALEWKFVEVAEDYLDQQRRGVAAPELQPVIFGDVYPLYAAVDVRGSSTARVDAIRADLARQLQLAAEVLTLAAATQPLPIVGELTAFAHTHQSRLRDGLSSDEENTILDTLRRDVEPLFEYLQATAAGPLREAIRRYFAALDPRLGIIYQRRRAFEQSQTRLNETISSLLDTEEARAQQLFPHYFRKAVTDGVEFDLYIGASLVPYRAFDALVLQRLRRWQLLALVRIAQATHDLESTLPVPLRTTQLLFIHSQALAIRFRLDERQFDVDGAHNARYEIIKKRLDKATIAGTGERLTQPGAIALVYSQAREAAEYEEYLQELRTRGLIGPEPAEVHALEEAQGVKGMHALRIWLRFG